MTHEQVDPIAIPLDDLRQRISTLAEEMKNATTPMAPALRARFVEARAALFQRGVFDPVLVRFDTASAPLATPQEIGEQLATAAQSI